MWNVTTTGLIILYAFYFGSYLVPGYILISILFRIFLRISWKRAFTYAFIWMIGDAIFSFLMEKYYFEWHDTPFGSICSTAILLIISLAFLLFRRSRFSRTLST
jgi:hypothetical protein